MCSSQWPTHNLKVNSWDVPNPLRTLIAFCSALCLSIPKITLCWMSIFESRKPFSPNFFTWPIILLVVLLASKNAGLVVFFFLIKNEDLCFGWLCTDVPNFFSFSHPFCLVFTTHLMKYCLSIFDDVLKKNSNLTTCSFKSPRYSEIQYSLVTYLSSCHEKPIRVLWQARLGVNTYCML